ncbi:MAG: HAD-IIB family hydrolase [Pseudomonadota bacterium]
MKPALLLCTDLDRTLMPNGEPPESPLARPLFRRLAERPDVTLAYVSGRHLGLLHEAIETYDLPVPDYAIGDVGTTLYAIKDGQWSASPEWSAEIAPDWAGLTHAELAEALEGFRELRLQEPAKQNTFKLSYYVPADIDVQGLRAAVSARLASLGVCASLIWSVDDLTGDGLFDILPERATKLHAIEFLARLLGVNPANMLFAGDSGNDLPVLASGIPSVLVHNARTDVRREALAQAESTGQNGHLYLAEGGMFGMNGNYAAGIMEGLAHFHPEFTDWLNEALKGL